MMAEGLSYGAVLPDQVDRVSSLSDAQLELLADIREVHQSRAALEREYATKLQALAKKAAERKSKRGVGIVFGDEPAKAWGEDTVKRNTLDAAYTRLIASIEESAQDHVVFADKVSAEVVDASKLLGAKHDEMKKKHMQFYYNLLADRDKSYAERQKMKQKYDDECGEVDTYRHKQDRYGDEKAARQYEQQLSEMQISKNTYIIATAAANATKSRFFREDVPLLEDQFQRLQSSLLLALLSLLQHAQALHTSHLSALQSRVSSAQAAVGAVDIEKDQALFVEYNVRPFEEPQDWGWEPCVGYYESGEMAIEPAPKIFLQNKLRSCRVKMDQVGPQVQAKKREVEQLDHVAVNLSREGKLAEGDDAMNNYLEAQRQLTLLSITASALATEIETISAALKGDEGGQQPHTFKSASFSIPTTCGYCKASIWGLSKQGKTCKSCGLSVHTKCEMKVPADCGAPKTQSQSTQSLSRTDTRASIASTSPSSRPVSSYVGPPSPSPSTLGPASAAASSKSARLLYTFSPSSEFELAVSEGTVVQIIEEDDGSGWVKVADGRGAKGLVPTTYIEIIDNEEPRLHTRTHLLTPRPENGRPKPGGKPASLGSGVYVRGLYTYQASGADELDVEEGEVFELSAGPNGGKDYAEGWWEGYNKNGQKGIFPCNYVESI